MAANGIKYAYKLGGLAASLTVFLCSALIFFNNQGHMNINTLIYALGIIVPAGAIVGYLGFQIGKIFDSAKKKKKLSKFK